MNLKTIISIGAIALTSVTFGATQKTQFSIFPGVQFGANKNDSINGVSLNLLGAENQDVSGVDLSLVGYRQINGNFSGVHLSLFFEAFRVKGDMSGVSLALWNDIQGNVNGGNLGFINTVGGNSIFQLGAINYTKGDVTLQFGALNLSQEQALVQLGFVNYTKSVNGVQIGLINGTKNLEGLQIGFVNYAENGIFPVLPLINFRKTLF